MKKIISLFKRNYDTDYLVRDEVVEGAEWVIAGEGVATRKFDGTCCMFRAGQLYKRRELKAEQKAPVNFEAATEQDPVTGKTQGWVPIGDGPEDEYHREALNRMDSVSDPTLDYDGTYELVGPKIQGNPDLYDEHILIRHGQDIIENFPRDYEGIKLALKASSMEGVVFHHPDGRMVKIKRKDFFK